MDFLSGEPLRYQPESLTAEIRENHRGCVRRIRNCIRMEDGGPIKAPEEHLSTSILEARALAGQIRSRQSFSGRVTLDRSASRIESRYPMIGTHL